jgi:hypothetical protein
LQKPGVGEFIGEQVRIVHPIVQQGDVASIDARPYRRRKTTREWWAGPRKT